jgi:hypothetical protein
VQSVGGVAQPLYRSEGALRQAERRSGLASSITTLRLQPPHPLSCFKVLDWWQRASAARRERRHNWHESIVWRVGKADIHVGCSVLFPKQANRKRCVLPVRCVHLICTRSCERVPWSSRTRRMRLSHCAVPTSHSHRGGGHPLVVAED